MKTSIPLIAGILVLSLVGCIAIQPADVDLVGKEVIDTDPVPFLARSEHALESFIDMHEPLSKKDLRIKEINYTSNHMMESHGDPSQLCVEIFLKKRRAVEMSDEDFDRLWQKFRFGILNEEDEIFEDFAIKFWQVLRRTEVRYIVREPFIRASINVDFDTIERVVFIKSVGIHGDGFGLVIDKTHGRVYYNPSNWNVLQLDRIPVFADFREDDLIRFAEVLEEANVREWQEILRGVFRQNWYPVSWVLGIEFSDGTIMRRSGFGHDGTGFPPEDQYAMLTDFIRILGSEIIERHNAESGQGG